MGVHAVELTPATLAPVMPEGEGGRGGGGRGGDDDDDVRAYTPVVSSRAIDSAVTAGRVPVRRGARCWGKTHVATHMCSGWRRAQVYTLADQQAVCHWSVGRSSGHWSVGRS